MHARLTLHTADPARLGELISHHKQDVTMDFEHRSGSRRMPVLVNGRAVVETTWRDVQALAATRGQAAARLDAGKGETSRCAASNRIGWISARPSWNDRGAR